MSNSFWNAPNLKTVANTSIKIRANDIDLILMLLDLIFMLLALIFMLQMFSSWIFCLPILQICTKTLKTAKTQQIYNENVPTKNHNNCICQQIWKKELQSLPHWKNIYSFFKYLQTFIKFKIGTNWQLPQINTANIKFSLS